MAQKKNSPYDHPQTERKHPGEWEKDLNPGRMKGQNIGDHPAADEPEVFYSSQIKEMRNLLGDRFSVEELREIPIVTENGRLQQGKTYINLRDPARKPFTATGDITISAQNVYIPKSETPYPLWNRLLGIEAPERT